MTHRIREAMKQEPLKSKLGSSGGFVEIDETEELKKMREKK
jgi:hypothetical protein